MDRTLLDALKEGDNRKEEARQKGCELYEKKYRGQVIEIEKGIHQAIMDGALDELPAPGTEARCEAAAKRFQALNRQRFAIECKFYEEYLPIWRNAIAGAMQYYKTDVMKLSEEREAFRAQQFAQTGGSEFMAPAFTPASVAQSYFDIAKDINNKNCVAIRFQKHSGQSEGLIIPNKDMQEYITFHNNCIKNTSDDADEKVIYSAMHKFALFDDMFNNSAGAELENVFKNIFDGDKQKFNSFLQKDLYEFFKKLKENLNISMIKGRDKDKKDLNSHALKMEYILRIIKFFKEKAGEGE